MADPATPSTNQGTDQDTPERETLRINLPPRPLKPASTKIVPTPRPNISAASTLPITPGAALEPVPVTSAPPAWSTAVTKPMANIARPPSGSIPQLPPKLSSSSQMPKMPVKSAAPPMTGAPSSSKTTPLFPKGLAPGSALGVAPLPPSEGRPITAVVPNPGVQAPQALDVPPVSSGKVGVVPPRVIVANPQAKVYVQSGRIEAPSDIGPVPHNSKPPALPMTQNLPEGFNNLASQVGASIPAEKNGPTAGARPPEPLQPQPPLIPGTPATNGGVTQAPGRPTTPDGKVAPVVVRKPTASLRLVDLPASPGSRSVTQALEPYPAPSPKPPAPIAKATPALPPTAPKLAPTVTGATLPLPAPPAKPPAPAPAPTALKPTPPISSPTLPLPAPVAKATPALSPSPIKPALPTVSPLPPSPLPVTKMTPALSPVSPVAPKPVEPGAGAPPPPPSVKKTASIPLPPATSDLEATPLPTVKETALIPPATVAPVAPATEATPPPPPTAKKTAAIPPPPPPTTRRLDPTPAMPPRPATVSPIKPVLVAPVAAVTAPVEVDKPQNKSNVVVPPSRVVAASPDAAAAATPSLPVTPVPAAAPSPGKPTIAPPRRTQAIAMPAAAAAVASAAMPKVGPTVPAVPTAVPSAVKPVSPVSPVRPAGISPVTPAASPVMPMKPVVSNPAVQPEANKKSGTAVVKNAPPKETARITVKPSLPGGGAPRAGVGNLPTVKPAGGAAPVVAAAAAGAAVAAVGGVKVATAAMKPKTGVVASSSSAKASPAGKPAAAAPVKFQAEDSSDSTLVTTLMAVVLALFTWGTAGLLLASIYQYI